MSLTIIEVKNSSNPKDEVVRLQAIADVNLRGYAIIDRTFNEEGKHSDEFRHIFLFPSKDIKKGEFIRLHTGMGTYRRVRNENETITHHFYWQSKSCVWNDRGGDVATLIKCTFIKSVTVPAVK